MQGAYLAFLGSPVLPAPRAPAQPQAGTVSPVLQSPALFLPHVMPAARPHFLCLLSPCCPCVLSVQPVPWCARGTARMLQLCPMFRLGFPAQGHVCCTRRAGKPTPLCHARCHTRCEYGRGFWVPSSQPGLFCRARAALPGSCKPTQAEPAWAISEWKDLDSCKPRSGRASCPLVPYQSGQPLQSCLAPS